MSDVIQFPQRQSQPDETDRLLSRLFAVATIAERAEAQAYTAHGIATTNEMRNEFLQAAIHIRRGYRLAMDQLTQPPKGAA